MNIVYMWERKEWEDLRVMFKFLLWDWFGYVSFKVIMMLIVMKLGKG